MKSLIAGIVVILLIGIGGFVYRNVKERTGQPEPMACTMEAKVCPDGSSVGRQGPACEFAACPPPNVEVAEAGVAFALPDGYVADENAYGADVTVLGAFTKSSLSGNPPHTIIVRRYPIAAGKTANETIIENTRFSPSDLPADSMDDFKPLFVNGKTFQSVVIERFEAQVHSAYYLARPTDVLRFEVIEHDVTEWMNPDLVVADLPQHKALLEMLATLQP